MNVRVAHDSRALRRAVGVTAWCVLEELVLDASVDDHERILVSTNVRRIAAALGVSKDTAARAVARLVRAGVVERVTSSRGERGAFPTSTYVVDVASVPGLTVDLLADNDPEPTRPAPRRMRPAPHVDNAQSSLFDLPASTS